MREITTKEELKEYLMSSADTNVQSPDLAIEFTPLLQKNPPTDFVLDALFRLIKEEGANPYQLKIAYFTGLYQAGQIIDPLLSNISAFLRKYNPNV